MCAAVSAPSAKHFQAQRLGQDYDAAGDQSIVQFGQIFHKFAIDL